MARLSKRDRKVNRAIWWLSKKNPVKFKNQVNEIFGLANYNLSAEQTARIFDRMNEKNSELIHLVMAPLIQYGRTTDEQIDKAIDLSPYKQISDRFEPWIEATIKLINGIGTRANAQHIERIINKVINTKLHNDSGVKMDHLCKVAEALREMKDKKDSYKFDSSHAEILIDQRFTPTYFGKMAAEVITVANDKQIREMVKKLPDNYKDAPYFIYGLKTAGHDDPHLVTEVSKKCHPDRLMALSSALPYRKLSETKGVLDYITGMMLNKSKEEINRLKRKAKDAEDPNKLRVREIQEAETNLEQVKANIIIGLAKSVLKEKEVGEVVRFAENEPPKVVIPKKTRLVTNTRYKGKRGNRGGWRNCSPNR